MTTSIPREHIASNPVADRIRALAAATPERAALRDDARVITFGELADRVASTAGAVRAALDRAGSRTDGPGAGAVVVPVITRRDVQAPMDILALHHAGVALVPIDAELPAEVVRDLWRRGGCSPVVVAPDGFAIDETLPGVEVVRPRTGAPVPGHPVRADALATVLFTSGTTGAPKGVMLDWSLVDAAIERFDEEILSGPPGATAGVVFPFHFWGGYQRALSIVQGRSLTIVDPTRLDSRAMLERLARDGAEVLGLVPSMVQVLAAAAASAGVRLERVRTVTLGGESVTWQHVDLVRSFTAADVTISNGYGGSEAPAGATRFDIPPDLASGVGPVPIGDPVAPDRIRLEPVDDTSGAPHQVVVCGPVAIGYLGDPELSARAFAVLPDGRRCWRTGDIVEPDAAGQLRHVGRIDELVKINGKIVAPAQTQTALLTLPGVHDACVLAQEVGPRTRLVAHVVVDDTIGPAAVRTALMTRLPAHQLPHYLVRHDRLPATVTTKVDRRALAAGPVVPWRVGAVVEPRDMVEVVVTERASEVLGVPIGVEDNVWEFGLDSLGALELAAALGDEGWEVEPGFFLDHPTPEAAARRLTTASPSRASGAVPMNADGDRPAIWAIPGGGAPALSYRSLAAALGPDQPLVVVEPRGYRSPGRPRLRVPAAARDVVTLMRTARAPGPVVVIGYSAGVVVAYEACHQLAAAGWQPHLVALDGGPARLPANPASGSRRDRLRRRTALLRDGAMAWWRWLVPDPHPNRVAFDRTFLTYARWAGRRYHPRPAAFPTVLVCRVDSASAACWPDPPDRTVTVTGDHTTMIFPPHVHQVVAVVESVVGEV